MISAQEKRIDKCEEEIKGLDGRLDKVETKTGLLQQTHKGCSGNISG